eukprot:824617-Pelagomonas_calceolata.AAC.1
MTRSRLMAAELPGRVPKVKTRILADHMVASCLVVQRCCVVRYVVQCSGAVVRKWCSVAQCSVLTRCAAVRYGVVQCSQACCKAVKHAARQACGAMQASMLQGSVFGSAVMVVVVVVVVAG